MPRRSGAYFLLVNIEAPVSTGKGQQALHKMAIRPFFNGRKDIQMHQSLKLN